MNEPSASLSAAGTLSRLPFSYSCGALAGRGGQPAARPVSFRARRIDLLSSGVMGPHPSIGVPGVRAANARGGHRSCLFAATCARTPVGCLGSRDPHPGCAAATARPAQGQQRPPFHADEPATTGSTPHEMHPITPYSSFGSDHDRASRRWLSRQERDTRSSVSQMDVHRCPHPRRDR